MPVRHGEQNRLGEQRAEELDFLLVAGGTEPAAFAGEGEQVFMLAVITADTGKPAFEIATVQEFMDDLRNDWAQEAMARLVAILVCVQKRAEMPR